MKQTSNTNKKRNKTTKSDYEWQDYFCGISFKMQPANDAFIEKFCLEWLEYLRDNQKMATMWYYPENIRGIHNTTFMRWAERNAFAKEAHALIKRICGNRRDHGAVYREMDAGYVTKSMPLYLEEWKQMQQEADEFKIKLANKLEGKASGQQIVVIERYPESDLVPKKETE